MVVSISRLNHVTLTFSAGEFAQLVKPIGDAYVRLAVRAVVANVGASPRKKRRSDARGEFRFSDIAPGAYRRRHG
jgi:hypothetical protein